MRFSNYKSAYQYLCQFTDYERITKFHNPQNVFSLTRIQRLMSVLGNPESRLKLIHIAGTKGKGSTAIFLSQLLQSSKHKVGLFTSPHLVDLRERIQINNQPISRKSFTEVMNSLLPHLKRIKPTFFETMTALALCYFAEEKVDYAIMEVGLGGRLDATNIINPLVSIITRIDFDHTDKLGHTLTRIAGEKAGIIKPNTPVITIKQQPEVMRVIRTYACKLKAPLYQIPKSKCLMSNFQYRVVGQHQKENLALALDACKLLKVNIRNPQSAIRNITLPARIEVVSRNPITIIDTAHNPVSMQALVDTIKTEFRYKQLVLVIGLARDKEVDKILRIILPLADIIIFTKSDNPRLLEPMDFIDYIKDYDLAVPIFLEPKCRKALRIAQAVAGRKDLILITGSFYLAGSLYPYLKK